jgi:hypothetical protein
MKKSNLPSVLLSFVLIILFLTPSYSHVVPKDQLRNQVYLSSDEALKKVFEGIRKIKKEKRKISRTQQKQIENILQRKFKDQRIEFYTAKKDSQKFYATIGKAAANSHPVTEAKFVLLIDSQGQVKDIHIMEYRGPQRAEIISRRFLNQYMNQSTESDLSMVTSNQGPTPSVMALNQAVQKILVLYKVLYLDSNS